MTFLESMPGFGADKYKNGGTADTRMNKKIGHDTLDRNVSNAGVVLLKYIGILTLSASGFEVADWRTRWE